MIMFIVRRVVAKAAYADSEYGPKLLAAKTLEDVRSILVEYCRAHGYKVAEVAARE